MEIKRYQEIRYNTIKTQSKINSNPSQESFISKAPEQKFRTTKKSLESFLIYKKVMAQMDNNAKQNPLQIRRLVPAKDLKQLLSPPAKPQSRAGFLQTNSYFNSRKQSLHSKHIQFKDDLSLNQQSSPTISQGVQVMFKRNRSITQKLVIINHQGKPTTYFKQ